MTGEAVTGRGAIARPRSRYGVGAAVRAATGVIATAARLVWRHWPILLVFYLAGAASRELVMRAAVRASAVHAVVGVSVLVLAPIATLSAIVLMLRVVRPSLPVLSAAFAGDPDHRRRPRWGPLDTLASALVPFLAVYASYGYLREDESEYAYRVWHETLGVPTEVDVLDRLPFRPTAALLSLVVVALALRLLLPVLNGVRRWAVLGLLGAYAEAIWLVPAAAYYQARYRSTMDWLGARRLVAWVVDGWAAVTDILGVIGTPVHALSVWLVGVLDSFGAVIVLPVAWLATGAVVYGRSIVSDPPTAQQLYERSAARSSAPPALLMLRAKVSSNLRSRFGPLVQGLGLLLRAGLGPMLLFCLAFVVANAASDWLWAAERIVIGPQDLGTVWVSVAGPLSLFNDAVRTVLVVCLLAAALERVIGTRPAAAMPASPVVAGRPDPSTEDGGAVAAQGTVVNRA